MKAARLVVLGVAVAAGGIAALLAGLSDKAPPPEPVAKIDMVDVLVAKADIGIGQAVSPQDMQWQTWPASNANPAFLRKNERPDAIEQISGSIARVPFSAGEPIREGKLIKVPGSGFLAAVLPAGMRAIATEISAETGAGGFILPNDHVDVILTRRDKAAEKTTGTEVVTSETILTNARVLAIDQTVEEKNGQKVVVGKTATLELNPRQAETLALARQQGVISLALRSIVDTANKPDATEDDGGRRAGINITRFGVTTMTTPK
jgi:pilus assembly protein CpaB